MGKHKTMEKELPPGQVNIMSLVDVSFVLVIFCLAALNINVTSGINVMESKAGVTKAKAVLSENVSITLKSNGAIYINDKRVVDSTYELMKQLSVLIPSTRDGMVIVKADDSNKCDQVVDILDIARKSGAKKLVLMRGVA
jgi:biopolymer transport protein ExbD